VQLGEAFGDQFLTTRPDPQLALALDHLGANTVPFPLDLPGTWRPEQCVELFGWRLQRVGQKERIGLAAALAVFIGRLGGDQHLVAGRRGAMADIGVADHPLGHAFGVQPGQLRQGAGDQQFGHAHAKTARDQLQAQHQAGAVQLRPQRLQALLNLLRR